MPRRATRSIFRRASRWIGPGRSSISTIRGATARRRSSSSARRPRNTAGSSRAPTTRRATARWRRTSRRWSRCGTTRTARCRSILAAFTRRDSPAARAPRACSRRKQARSPASSGAAPDSPRAIRRKRICRSSSSAPSATRTSTTSKCASSTRRSRSSRPCTGWRSSTGRTAGLRRKSAGARSNGWSARRCARACVPATRRSSEAGSTGRRRQLGAVESSRPARGKTSISTPSSITPLSCRADFRRCTSMS